MDTINLNLARKWRSKNFDQIVGQELSIKMLKNSLYLGQFFPVYLFSGQRGCGKTTTARIFAAAINCQGLSAFQKNPKQSAVPCLACTSCVAMMQGQHPDFFEIDAASHTGVDTIRQIIDASQLLPLMGSKKIYLIDEAHMLSKASFNALLKILEEPPRSVLFILATTDDQKIIDTVKSRCFQLFFRPIESDSLLKHLQHMCQAEKIAADDQALQLIIQESEGSARDAINLLEQVRFSSGRVNKEAVLSVLGHLDDEKLLALFHILFNKKPADLLTFMQEHDIESYSADFVWDRCIELLRSAVWLKHGVKPKQFMHQEAALMRLVKNCPWPLLNDCLDLFYSNEAVFAKTTTKHALLEMILLQLCQKNKSKNNDDASGMPPHAQTSSAQEQDYVAEDDDMEDDSEEDDEIEEEEGVAACWKRFAHSIEGLSDPLLRSIFMQGKVITFDQPAQRLDVEFSKELSFFKDWLDESSALWQPLLHQAFSAAVIINPLFTGASKSAPVEKKVPAVVHQPVARPTVQKPSEPKVAQKPQQQFERRSFATSRSYADARPKLKETVIDVSDVALWPKAHLLLRHFSGTITEVKEVSRET